MRRRGAREPARALVARGMAGAGAALPAGGGASVRRETLPNGATVIVQENRASPVVAMTLLVGVGSRHESAETNGVTALLGRVLLKGTRARSALEIAQAAEDAGGSVESGTDQEYSEVGARGLARHWGTLLDLVHEVVTAPTLADGEVEREREALVGQIRGLEDQPFQVANRLLNRGLFGAQGYGLPTSGELATVAALSRGELAWHRETFYTADRMVLAVSGDVPGDAVLAEAVRLFAPVAPGRGTSEPAGLPARPARARSEERRPTQQAQVLVGYLAPPVWHADHVAIKVMNTVLGGGMSSRLFRVLRDEEGLAYAVGSVYPMRREVSRVVVHIGTAPSNVAAAEAGIRREIERLRALPVPEDELVRARASLRGAFVLDRRTNVRRSFHLGFFELMGVGHGFLERYPELIERVSTDDVQRVARRYLTDPAVAVVGPG